MNFVVNFLPDVNRPTFLSTSFHDIYVDFVSSFFAWGNEDSVDKR